MHMKVSDKKAERNNDTPAETGQNQEAFIPTDVGINVGINRNPGLK